MPAFAEAFIVLVPGSDPAQRYERVSAMSRTQIVPVPDAETAAAVARTLLADGLDLIELYGGLGPSAAAAIIAAADGRVPVGLVGLDPPVTEGDLGIVFESPGADPASDRYEFTAGGRRTTIVAVPEVSRAVEAARSLVDEGATRLEVCGGMGAGPAAAVREAVGDRATVGAVLFGFESLPSAASYQARFEDALAAQG